MAKGPTPTKRTLDLYRDQGFVVGVVETHNHFSGKKNDLYGFIDIVAIREGETLGIQATSTGNLKARVHKILAEPRAKVWLAAGNKIVAIGWRKYAKPIDRKHWRPTIIEITGKDFENGDEEEGC